MKRLDDRVDLQVSLLLAVFVAVVTLTCFGVSYNVTYRDMKFSLRERVEYIRDHLESRLDLSAFPDIESREDMDREEYRTIHEVFSNVKEAAGTMYLYTEEVYPDEIVHTSWGDIFICYLPLYSGRKIVGVLGIEFEAAHQYKTYQKLKIFVPIAVVFFTLLAFWVSRRMFLHINEIVKRQNEQKEILAEALHNAELASKAKSSFLFNISHDIQTPMNAIIGFARLAKDHVDDRRQVLDYLRKVERAGSHLRRLINDVLDMARLEKGSLELELAPCDIRVSVRETEQLFRSRMEEKGLSFDVRLEELRQSYVFCDSLRMKQIALNLLSNALEYTKAGGSVVYEIRQTGTDPEGYVYLEMRIRDTGVGMS